MVGPSNAAALPPRHKEKRRCARRIQSVRGAARAPANRPASRPALARASGRFYYQSHDITETVANQAADPLECGYYHNTDRVLCVSTRARPCVCVCACRFTRFASSSLFFFSSAVSFFHYYFYYYYHRRLLLLLLLYFFSSSSIHSFSFPTTNGLRNSCPRFLDRCRRRPSPLAVLKQWIQRALQVHNAGLLLQVPITRSPSRRYNTIIAATYLPARRFVYYYSFVCFCLSYYYDFFFLRPSSQYYKNIIISSRIVIYISSVLLLLILVSLFVTTEYGHRMLWHRG